MLAPVRTYTRLYPTPQHVGVADGTQATAKRQNTGRTTRYRHGMRNPSFKNTSSFGVPCSVFGVQRKNPSLNLSPARGETFSYRMDLNYRSIIAPPFSWLVFIHIFSDGMNDRRNHNLSLSEDDTVPVGKG